MSRSDRCLIRSRGLSGEPVVRLGSPLVEDYLEFLAARCRPNTVLAAAYDLRVFFGVVDKPAEDVRATDVLGFITAQRAGRSNGARLQPVELEQLEALQVDNARAQGWRWSDIAGALCVSKQAVHRKHAPRLRLLRG